MGRLPRGNAEQLRGDRIGELVAREVDRYRARRVREGSADEQELLEALERARELHAELAGLVKRLERRIDLRAARAR